MSAGRAEQREAAASRTKRRPFWLFPLALIAGIALALLVLPFGVGVQVFRAPSGSMQPAIFPGDYIIVAKWSYGYSRYSSAPLSLPFPAGRVLARAPERGDLAVFRPATDPGHAFIKRVVGLPGDEIQVIDGLLHINGVAVARASLGVVAFRDGEGGAFSAEGRRETLPNGVSYVVLDRVPAGELDNTRVFRVPEGRYFVMGDDRDNSADSRTSIVGFVPFDNFIGQVVLIAPTSPARGR